RHTRSDRDWSSDVCSSDLDDVPQGEVGEIAARTPAAMAAIWRDPQATAERTLPDGSVLTRDMGYLDEDGFLFLADRKEDMIISRSEERRVGKECRPLRWRV